MAKSDEEIFRSLAISRTQRVKLTSNVATLVSQPLKNDIFERILRGRGHKLQTAGVKWIVHCVSFIAHDVMCNIIFDRSILFYFFGSMQ